MAAGKDNIPIHLPCWWRCQSCPWANSVAWQRRVEDLQSSDRTIEASVRSGPCCVGITLHLIITPSNPTASFNSWLKHQIGGAWLIPVLKPLWGLISLHNLTSTAMGFKTRDVSDGAIVFLALASPRQTCTDFRVFRYECYIINVDNRNHSPWPQNRLHYSSWVETRHSLLKSFVRSAASMAVDSQ